MVFSYAELLQNYNNYVDAKGKIRRLIRDETLIPIGKGLYENNADVNPSYLAPWIYSPSYLSFDYVLSLYGMIPEKVCLYTSATFGKRKKKLYTNAFGSYSYQDIPHKAYPYGVKVETDGSYSYQIATCEKALCDKLYTLHPVRNIKELNYLLFEDLRIDEDVFLSLNMKDILFLCPLYHSTNLNYLSKLVQRRKNDKRN